MLRKDDLLEVVFDPGADKREKGIPGQTVLCAFFISEARLFALSRGATNDTGWVRRRRLKDRRVDATQLF